MDYNQTIVKKAIHIYFGDIMDVSNCFFYHSDFVWLEHHMLYNPFHCSCWELYGVIKREASPTFWLASAGAMDGVDQLHWDIISDKCIEVVEDFVLYHHVINNIIWCKRYNKL